MDRCARHQLQSPPALHTILLIFPPFCQGQFPRIHFHAFLDLSHNLFNPLLLIFPLLSLTLSFHICIKHLNTTSWRHLAKIPRTFDGKTQILGIESPVSVGFLGIALPPIKNLISTRGGKSKVWHTPPFYCFYMFDAVASSGSKGFVNSQSNASSRSNQTW